jgi:hypothetical protein
MLRHNDRRSKRIFVVQCTARNVLVGVTLDSSRLEGMVPIQPRETTEIPVRCNPLTA